MRILDQVTARQAATATARDQAIDLADECNNHRAMLINCLQWMDHAAISAMLEVNGWTDGETVYDYEGLTKSEYRRIAGLDD